MGTATGAGTGTGIAYLLAADAGDHREGAPWVDRYRQCVLDVVWVWVWVMMGQLLNHHQQHNTINTINMISTSISTSTSPGIAM
jgi:hypothetical protein